MTPSHTRRISAALIVAGVAVSFSATPGAAQAASQTATGQVSAAVLKARADSARYPYTAADIRFMSEMIAHHTQAIAMSNLAPTHGASPAIRTLASRIINAQEGEITGMKQWLRDRGQPIPEASAAGMKMMMDGAEHMMLMPGMLTPEQMAQLDQARGLDFDRLFLTFMIQHHRGAISMVKDLFGTYGAGQDELVFKFASDVNVDQTTEIARMEQMLFNVMIESRTK